MNKRLSEEGIQGDVHCLGGTGILHACGILLECSEGVIGRWGLKSTLVVDCEGTKLTGIE